MACNDQQLTALSCRGFARELASKTSVPGGGGAAALAGALGTALCSMVGEFTLGKKKYASVEEDIKALLSRADTLRERLMDLVELDAALFAPLAAAYAIPKDAPGREETLESATKQACTAPYEMVKCCGEAVELLEEMLEKGSVMLLSDVGCGALLAKAAMECAAMNVYINTKSLRDRPYAGHLETEMEEILHTQGQKADRIARTVLSRVKGE
jgi:formiminotetrahydrofolate cyclodeaminase